MLLDKTKCSEIVYKRDCYRRTGRGPTGFEMHYSEDQCQRKRTHGDKCWQHDPENRQRLREKRWAASNARRMWKRRRFLRR